MFIEMLDLLRCINAHEETWLVASLKAISNRFVLDGTLGCPICHAEYPIRHGIADFTRADELTTQSSEISPSRENREELATRIGAFLNATEPGTTVVLGGTWAEAAQELSVMTDIFVLALNASKRVEESETVGLIRVTSEIPLSPGSVLGVALDASFPAEAISSALKVVRPAGRIVAPVKIKPPGDLAVLASDERYWVAEKPVEMIPLQRSKISK